MQDPYADLAKKLRETVLAGPGKTDPKLRQAAANGENRPPEIVKLTDKVAKYAYKVTDEDVAALLQAG